MDSPDAIRDVTFGISDSTTEVFRRELKKVSPNVNSILFSPYTGAEVCIYP
jgi:hypothetical protein